MTGSRFNQPALASAVMAVLGVPRFRPGSRLLGFLLASSLALPVPAFPLAGAMAAGQASKLVGHRAIYDMSLDRSRENSGVSGVKGRMVFDFSGSRCDGYTLNMRLVTLVTDQSGRSTMTDLRSSTWEDGTGRKFHFNSTQYLNQKLNETTSGKAARQLPEKTIEVRVVKPAPNQLRVTEQVLFPTQHSLAILAAAIAGKRVLQANVYDGSEKGRKIYATTTFIGKPLPPGTGNGLAKVPNSEILDGLVSWRVSISYFDKQQIGDASASYELNFRLYSNGVSRKLLIDYGDFAVRGALKSLEMFDATGCD